MINLSSSKTMINPALKATWFDKKTIIYIKIAECCSLRITHSDSDKLSDLVQL